MRWEDDDQELRPPSSYLKAALFTSATLGIPGRPLPQAFAEFMNSVGIFRLPRKGETHPLHFVQEDLFRSFEPVKFGAMKFVLADPRTEDPILPQDEEAGRIASTCDKWLDYCAGMIRGAHSTGGRTLVLTGSFSDAFRLKERLSSLSGLLVHEQGHSLSSLLPAFRRNDHGTLISPSGWEGLDLPGLLSNVVITRIPNPRPDSVELVLLRLTLQHQGFAEDKIERLIRGRIFAESRRKLAQGLGRGIRQATDNVTIWIADPRFPLPESVSASLDPIILSGKVRRSQQLLLQSIPTRFRREFEQAKLWTVDGELYTPEL